MFRSKWIMSLALAAFVLLFAVAAGAKEEKKQVTRPFTIYGDVIVTLAPVYYASATGVATHIGKYSGEAAIPGKAVLIAANGDELHWDEVGSNFSNPTPDQITFTMNFIITGGTGRFEGASGSFGPVTVTTSLSAYPVLKFSYSTSGTITY